MISLNAYLYSGNTVLKILLRISGVCNNNEKCYKIITYIGGQT